MKTTSQNTATMRNTNEERADAPSAKEVEEALKQMLAELEFARNPSPAKFLQFVVYETLAGRGARLKAYAIATAALGRSENFDPQNDSIVRVQAVRVRSMLNTYYAGRGATDSVRIEIPLGAYQAKFAYVSPLSPPPVEVGDVPETETAPTKVAPASKALAAEAVTLGPAGSVLVKRVRSARGSLLLLAVIAGFAIVILLALAILSRPRVGDTLAHELDGPPAIFVEVPLASPRIAASVGAQHFLTSLEQGLSALDYFTIRMASPKAENGRGDYTLTAQFIPAGLNMADVDLKLRRADTGDVLWSRQLPPLELNSTENAQKAGILASSAVADVGGAIFSDLHEILLTLPTRDLRGYACRVAGLDYLRNREQSQRDSARNCLKASVLEDPENVGLLSTLSTILLLDYLDATPGGQSVSGLQDSLQLARRAYDLAPQQASGQAALFYGRFFDKRFEDAFEIEQQAMATNSNSMLLTLRVGRAYVSRGRYVDGIDLLKKVDSMASGEQPIATAFLALAEHMLGDYDTQRRLLARPGVAKSAMGLALRIIDCHERADVACVQSASAKMQETFPGFAADIPAALDRYALAAPLQDYLLQGLRSAGFAGAK